MLPKTRSGKIMRRVFKAVVLDQDPGDITTIEDEGSVEEARQAWHRHLTDRAAAHKLAKDIEDRKPKRSPTLKLRRKRDGVDTPR